MAFENDPILCSGFPEHRIGHDYRLLRRGRFRTTSTASDWSFAAAMIYPRPDARNISVTYMYTYVVYVSAMISPRPAAAGQAGRAGRARLPACRFQSNGIVVSILYHKNSIHNNILVNDHCCHDYAWYPSGEVPV